MNAIVEMKPQAGALVSSHDRMAVAEILSHVTRVQEVMRAVMKPDVHYGIIPGTDKPTLLKPGAELLCMTFRIGPTYHVEDLSTDLVVRYRSTCIGTHQTTGVVMGTGMGEASSGEGKYKWVKAYREEWDATPENLRRIKYGWDKKKREKYEVMQVRTDPADLANTILKMANKRAYLAMVLSVTAASDCFSQDLDDMEERLREHLAEQGGGEPQAEAPAEPPIWPDDAFEKQLPKMRAAIANGKKAEDIIAWAESKGKLTEAQKARITAKDEPEAPPAITYAEVADKLTKAQNRDALYIASDLIKSIPDESQRAELTKLFEQRDAELPE